MPRKYITAAVIGLLALTADQVSKVAARAVLSPMRVIDLVPGIAELRYAENTGIAFGLFTRLPPAVKLPLFTCITLVAVFIILHLLRQAPALAVRLPAALGFVLAGALGNLLDRFHWPGVVDFIRIQAWPPSNYYWPTFNLADTSISIGIALLILDTLLTREPESKEGEKPPPTTSAPPESPSADVPQG